MALGAFYKDIQDEIYDGVSQGYAFDGVTYVNAVVRQPGNAKGARIAGLEAQATFKLTSADKLSVAYGVRRVDNGSDYNAWNIGVKHKFTPAVAGDLRWYDTDEHDLGSRYEGRLVASLSYSF